MHLYFSNLKSFMYHNFRKIEIPGALEKNVTAHNIFFYLQKKKFGCTDAPSSLVQIPWMQNKLYLDG